MTVSEDATWCLFPANSSTIGLYAVELDLGVYGLMTPTAPPASVLSCMDEGLKLPTVYELRR